MQKILETFEQLKNNRIKDSENYENNESYEMAYIALWSIIETILKDIETKRKKDILLEKVTEWKNYLEGKRKKPSKINSFEYVQKNIPPISGIEDSLGLDSCPTIREIINTNSEEGTKMWRNKRNDIAHKAKGFKNYTTYKKYKDKILKGIKELEKNLIAKSNKK